MYSYNPDKPGNTRDMRRGHSRSVLDNPLTLSRLLHKDFNFNQYTFTVLYERLYPLNELGGYFTTLRVEPVKLENESRTRVDVQKTAPCN